MITIKKCRMLNIISLVLAVLLLGSCSSDDSIKIENLDSLAGMQIDEYATTAVQSAAGNVADTQTTEKTVYEEVRDTAQSQQNDDTDGRTVYITPSGKRYHLSSTCGGKNSYSVSINDVGSRTPCKKCAQ